MGFCRTDILIHIVNTEDEEVYDPDAVVGIIWPPNSGNGNAIGIADEIRIAAVKVNQSTLIYSPIVSSFMMFSTLEILTDL